MGKPTGKFVRVTKSTGGGSDRHGPCELCGKHMSETFLSSNKEVWVREDGTEYLGFAVSVFAHKDCIEKLG